jgi:hypothetical protein
MTKKGIAEQVIKRLYPDTPLEETKPSLPSVMLAAGQARDEMVRLMTWARLDEGAYSPNYQCIQSYKDVQTAYDEDMCKWFCALPARVVDLPMNMGIYHVATMDCPDEAYIPSELGSNSTSVYGDGGVARYYPEKKKIYFNRDLGGKKMFLRLVPRGEDIDPLADLLFPPDMEQALVDETEKRFLKQRQIPVDSIDNRNPQ